MINDDLIVITKEEKKTKKGKRLKIIKDTSSYNNSPSTCLLCGSTNIRFNGGKFMSRTSFRQKMFCDDCKCEWFAILNNSGLKADWLEIEIKEGD